MLGQPCSKCGRELMVGASFCVACGTPTSHRNVEKQNAEKQSGGKVIMEAKGNSGDLLLLEDRVIVRQKGWFGLPSPLADREIPIHEITAIAWKTGWTGGRISFTFAGTETSIGLSGVDMRNTVMFTSQEQEAFVAIKQAIDKRIAAIHAAPRASSGLDDLERLASLRDKGVITEDEFQQKKKQILGL
jgi:ribosomal protein L37E